MTKKFLTSPMILFLAVFLMQSCIEDDVLTNQDKIRIDNFDKPIAPGGDEPQMAPIYGHRIKSWGLSKKFL